MHTLKFTDEQLSVIDRALQEMPFRLAAPLIQEINRQLAAKEDGADDAAH